MRGKMESVRRGEENERVYIAGAKWTAGPSLVKETSCNVLRLTYYVIFSGE